MRSTATWSRLVLGLGLAVWIVNAVAVWLAAPQLGHDETQYAIGAADLLSGHVERWFYRSQGTCVLGIPGVLAGRGDLAMRFVPLLFGVGFVLAAWRVARRAFGDATAAWTVAVLAGSRSYMKHSADLLSDMPAATCLLAATAVILGELGRETGPRWRAVLAAPLLAAAFYLRYASCVPIALLGAAWLAFDGRGISRRPAPVIAAAALFALLLVPHVAAAIALTGSPLGILLGSGVALQGAYVGEGLVGYLTANPFAFYGLLTVPILIVGITSLRPSSDRRTVLLWLVAITSIVGIGLSAAAQVRYVFFGTALLAILGVDAIRRAAGRIPPRARRAIAACAMAALAATWVLVLRSQLRRRGAADPAIRLAAEAIRNDAAGRPCQLIAQNSPQLEWYSGCRSNDFAGYSPLERDEPLYLMRDQTPGFQPELSGGPGRRATILQVPGLVQVVRVESEAVKTP